MIKSENVNSMSDSDSSEEDIEEKSRLLEAVVNVIPQSTPKHVLINQTGIFSQRNIQKPSLIDSEFLIQHFYDYMKTCSTITSYTLYTFIII